MKIAVDGSPLLTPMTGIGYYWKPIISGLSELLENDEQLALYAFYWNNFPARSAEIKKDFQNIFIEKKIPEKFLEIITSGISPANFDKLTGYPDIVNYTSLKFPPTSAKKIYTVYDISFMENSDFHTNTENKKHRSFLKKIIESQDKILTISEFTKLRLIELAKISPDRISVIYPVLPQDIKITKNRNNNCALKKYSIREPFVFFNGTIEPRKNIANLVNAYLESNAYKQKIQLVISGKLGWHYDRILGEIAKYDKSLVIFTGYTSREEAVEFYNSALFFIYPSLYEGFGLPVIEAMGCGCPVITSDIEVLREIAGDSAIFVNPVKKSEITDAINLMLDNSSVRDNCRILGIATAERFRSQEPAAKLLELYRSSVKGEV